jgi:hypothetical protein
MTIPTHRIDPFLDPLDRLFSTHPPDEKRIEVLKQMEQQMMGNKPTIASRIQLWIDTIKNLRK